MKYLIFSIIKYGILPFTFYHLFVIIMFLFCTQVKLMNLLIHQEINHHGSYEVKLFIDLKWWYGLVIGSFINKTFFLSF